MFPGVNAWTAVPLVWRLVMKLLKDGLENGIVSNDPYPYPYV